MASWQRCRGGGLLRRWQGGNGVRVVRWQWEIPGVIREWGHRVSPKFHLFVFDVDQQPNKGAE